MMKFLFRINPFHAGAKYLILLILFVSQFVSAQVKELENITSIYGSGFLKKYELRFEESSKSISYRKYRQNESETHVVKAVWQDNCFVIDDYYLGEDLNDEPMPFPG